MQDYKKLKVWEKGHALAMLTYKLTKKFPKEELYGLTSQMRRAASSIPANIAEGCGRGSQAELRRFLTIASGSASELDYHAYLSKDLALLSDESYSEIHSHITELRKMLNAFIQTLTTNNQKLTTEVLP